ncbi:MAG: biotin--[acetyl-CoA-carboxylase] ligase [Rhodospirillales bacterium CG15_BIG_FIL_POST_REV_8_21_14_020_66_15]|nr:MAG: biotin--[acetyl-CoA-carboxylase] ligase [Rhodospirillales bacterium CG15_BIG_FIL_POST_REV_8_21_14_020_66_15]
MDAPKLPSLFTLVELETVDSTNAEARRLAERGPEAAPEGTLVWAMEQTAGRGRRGRTWVSPKGNFYCSVILRPEVPLKDAAQFGFVASLAVYDTIGGLAQPGTEAHTKWPNDVLVAGRKVAGILLEAQGAATPDAQPDFVIVGVGVNLVSFPEDVEFPATCMLDEGTAVMAPEFLEGFARHFLGWTRIWVDEGFERLRKNWLWRCDQVGKQVEVRLANETLTGTFKDLDETGALILETASGPRTITAGDVYFPRPQGA